MTNNLTALSDEYKELLKGISTSMGLDRYVTIKGIHNPKQKFPVIVSKANATSEYLTKEENMVCVYVNETVMDGLDSMQKRIIMEDALSTIYYDTEKDKISINKPEIMVTLWGHKKYGDDIINALESAYLYNQSLIEKEKEEKDNNKKNKKNE